jgi:hypothetical protein
MGEIRDHRDLEAWRVAMDAVVETYRLSVDYPKRDLDQRCEHRLE